MLNRLNGLLERRRRARDERGSTMVVVLTVVLVGVVLSTAIASSSMGSVRQTTHGRSNVQAFAAAEAGRDSMAAAISQVVPACASASGSVDAATWSATLHYVPGTSLPSGTTYAADGSPQPAAAWTTVTCGGLAAAGPGDYMVVVASTGTAADGTSRVISAAYPFHVEPPDNSIVSTVQGPFSIGSSGTGSTGTPAWSGGPLVVNGPPGQTNFVCGTPTAQPVTIEGDVYVLAGDAEFPGPGCRIKGDLYVQGNVRVRGYNSLGLLFGGNRHLWVTGDIRVGGDFDQRNGGLTVGGGITAGGDINLSERESTWLSESFNQVKVGTAQGPGELALWSGGNVKLRYWDQGALFSDGGVVNGRIKAGGAVDSTRGVDDETGSGYGGNWRVTGSIAAGTAVTLKNTPSGGIASGGTVTATNSSPVSGAVTAGGAVSLNDAPVNGAVRTAGAVTATDSTITGKVTSLNQSVTLNNSGSGEIVAKGNVTTTGNRPITGPVTAGGGATLTANVTGDVAVNGIVSVTGATVTGSVSSAYAPTGGAEFSTTLTDATVTGTVRASSGGVVVTRGSVGGLITAGGRVALIGPLNTKGVATTGRIEASGGGTLGGDITSSTTATGSPAVSVSGMTVGGSVRANRLVRVVTTTVNGHVESGSDVQQTGGRIWGRVLANGSYTGNPSGGVRVEKSIIAGGSVTVQNDATNNATVVGDGSENPAIWAGGKITLLGSKEAMTSVRGKVTGDLRSTSGAPAILVQRTWTVTGQLQAAGSKTVPALDTDCGAEAICSEGQKTNVPRHLEGGCYWNSAGSAQDWSGDARFDTPEECNAARGGWWSPAPRDQSNVGNNYPCGLLASSRCIWRGPGWVEATYYPAADTGPSAAPTGTRPTAPTTSVALPDVTVTIPTAIPGVTIPPTAPAGPTTDDIAVSEDGSVLLDAGHWLDLSYDQVKAAAIESGYTQAMTYSGTDCKRGWGGITDSKAEREISNALAVSGKKYLVDTTACNDPLTNFIAFSRINSDAVILVKNYEDGATGTVNTNGTLANPRRVYVIQPDSQLDRNPTCNNSNAPGNTQPTEQSGRNRFKFSSTYGTDKVHTMFYSPCGLGSPTGTVNTSTFYGQVVAGASSSAEFTEFFCRPMKLGSRPLFNLTCDGPLTAADVDGSAGIKTYTLSSPTVQTEP